MQLSPIYESMSTRPKRNTCQDQEPRHDGLQPLPPPPKIPDLPNTGKCKWSFDQDSRVLRADFVQENGDVEILQEDETFLLKMFERDDIVCVMNGLLNSLDSNLYDPSSLVKYIGEATLTKIRKFVDENDEDENRRKSTKRSRNSAPGGDMEETKLPQYVEAEGFMSMRFADFVQYMAKRQDAMNGGNEKHFTFTNEKGKSFTIDLLNTVLYSIDEGIEVLYNPLFEGLKKNFKLPGCLPGGTYCLTNAVRIQ